MQMVRRLVVAACGVALVIGGAVVAGPLDPEGTDGKVGFYVVDGPCSASAVEDPLEDAAITVEVIDGTGTPTSQSGTTRSDGTAGFWIYDMTYGETVLRVTVDPEGARPAKEWRLRVVESSEHLEEHPFELLPDLPGDPDKTCPSSPIHSGGAKLCYCHLR